MKLFILACAFALSGCATDLALTKWTEDNQVKAQAGSISWTDYYTQLYQRTEAANITGKGQALNRVNVMIAAARAYDAKQMSKEDFQNLQRIARAQQAIDEEAADNETRRRMAIGLNSMPKPVTCTSQGWGNSVQTTCR